MIVRINEVSKDVDFQVLHMRGNLDAGNKVHTDPTGFYQRYRKTLQGVVIGNG